MKIHPAPALLNRLAVTLLSVAFLYGSNAFSQTLILDLQSSNYSVPTTGSIGGVWQDSSASNNDATAVTYYVSPGLKTNATPSGSPAVDFAYNGYFQQPDTSNSKALALANALTGASFTTSPSFTINVVAKMPAVYLFTNFYGGSENSNLSFAIQNDGSLYLNRGGSSVVAQSPVTGYTAGEWAVFSVTYDSSGNYAFYLNGVQKGTGTNAKTFTTPTSSRVASNYGGNPFYGEMAALQIYDGAMTSTQVATQSNLLYNTYLVPEPTTWALLGLGLLIVTVFRRRAPQN